MDLRLDDEQKLLQSSFTRLFAEHCPLAHVRELEAANGHDPMLWARLADLGALGLLVPERHGGLAGSLLDAALLFEAAGGALYPGPLLWSAVVAPFLLVQLGDPAAQAAWLPQLVAGTAIITLADDRASAMSAAPVLALPVAGGYQLRGTAQFVEYAPHASQLLIAAQAADQVALFLAPPDRAGLSVARRSEISGGQFFRVDFADLPVAAGERLGGDAGPALTQALDRARVALAARTIGAAQRVFDLTLRYLRERSQFGRPLIDFQALNFRLAALLARIDAARLLAYHAAWLADAAGAAHDQAFAIAARGAKAQAAETYREMAAEAIQLHGGFGFTAEASPQLFYRRAASDALLLGSATALREQIGGALI